MKLDRLVKDRKCECSMFCKVIIKVGEDCVAENGSYHSGVNWIFISLDCWIKRHPNLAKAIANKFDKPLTLCKVDRNIRLNRASMKSMRES